ITWSSSKILFSSDYCQTNCLPKHTVDIVFKPVDTSSDDSQPTTSSSDSEYDDAQETIPQPKIISPPKTIATSENTIKNLENTTKSDIRPRSTLPRPIYRSRQFFPNKTIENQTVTQYTKKEGDTKNGREIFEKTKIGDTNQEDGARLHKILLDKNIDEKTKTSQNMPNNIIRPQMEENFSSQPESEHVQNDHVEPVNNFPNKENSKPFLPDISDTPRDPIVIDMDDHPDQLPKIPNAYSSYCDVFSKIEAEMLPKHRDYDLYTSPASP
ncbi:hypothetical protein BB559_005165, partial [Furculomyces boomerangus]